MPFPMYVLRIFGAFIDFGFSKTSVATALAVAVFLKVSTSDFPFLKILLPFLMPRRIAFCSSSDKWITSTHSEEQQPSIAAAHASHWMNNKWQPSFAQFV